MVGIYDCFGYGGSYDVPFEERYRLIKRAGFDCVMLWWSDKFGRGRGYQEDVRLAKKAGLEIDNMHTPVHEQNCLSSDNLDMVLNTFQSKFTGYCYDSCHHQNYAPDSDLLNKYGNRLMALHLHDNGGKNNQHQLPFDGNIDWRDVMKKITLTGYQGATTLEPMNWDYEDLSIQKFLDCAYQKAKLLNDMRKL